MEFTSDISVATKGFYLTYKAFFKKDLRTTDGRGRSFMPFLQNAWKEAVAFFFMTINLSLALSYSYLLPLSFASFGVY